MKIHIIILPLKKMDYVIENKKYIFSLDENVYELEFTDDSNNNNINSGTITNKINNISDKIDENKFYKFAIIMLALLVIFICAILGFKYLNKNED